MKKFLTLFTALLMISACSPKEEKQEETTNTPTINATIDDEVFSFDVNTLQKGCSNPSQMLCAISMTVKCTVNPQFSECAENKKNMPKFVFMDDENLKRPTSQSYKITKIKPISDGMVEVYTQSTCNGNWFGLCNGNIIYVMNSVNDQWIVKDIYAIED